MSLNCVKHMVVVALLSLSQIAAADRFSDTDYECERANAKPELGFRCLVARQDGPAYLYVYELPVELDTASAKRRNYQRNQIQKGFLASGGIFVSQFWRKDGKLMSRACSRGKGKPASAGVWCGERFEVTEAQMNPIKARLTQ